MVVSKRLRVLPDSELSSLLHDALVSGEPVLVDTGETIYRLGIESAATATPTGHSPTAESVERSRRGIREAAGSWGDIDAEAFKQYIRERRQTSSRPPVDL